MPMNERTNDKWTMSSEIWNREWNEMFKNPLKYGQKKCRLTWTEKGLYGVSSFIPNNSQKKSYSQFQKSNKFDEKKTTARRRRIAQIFSLVMRFYCFSSMQLLCGGKVEHKMSREYGFNFHTFLNSSIMLNEWTKMCQKMHINEISSLGCKRQQMSVCGWEWTALEPSWMEK